MYLRICKVFHVFYLEQGWIPAGQQYSFSTVALQKAKGRRFPQRYYYGHRPARHSQPSDPH